MRLKGKLFLTTVFATILGVSVFGGVFSIKSKRAELVKAGSETKSRIVLELEDQCYATSDARDPILHLWNVSVDSSMEYDSTNLKDEMIAAGVVNDLEGGGANVKQINSDGSIDTGFTWSKQEGSKRYWVVQLPWYITGFKYKLHCGSYWGSSELTVTKRGSHMTYTYGSWDNWDNSLSQDTSSKSSTYSVTNYAITASTSGGAPSSSNTALVKGNGGSFVTSGNYFPRQKISLKATAGTYSEFDHWNYGHDTSSATTYDYVETAGKTYTATFSDTRSQYTVVFKDEDGTTLETKNNVYQGSSVSATSTPTKPDEGGKQFVFSKWVSDTGVDMTSSLANVQGNLTVYASYVISGYKTGRYIAGTFPEGTSDDWAVSGGVYMTSTGTAGEYTGTVTLAFGDLVKIPYYNGSSFEYNLAYDSYDALIYTASAYYCFGSNGGSNHEIKCYAAGSYTFKFNDNAYDGEHKITVSYNGALTAQHLAAKLMNFTEYAGHCGDNDRFPAMRTIYLGLASGEQTIFRGYASSGTAQFQNAYNRYTAWARALGENPWANEKLSAIRISTLMNASNSTSIIIIAMAVICVASVGGYFIFKRKRQ